MTRNNAVIVLLSLLVPACYLQPSAVHNPFASRECVLVTLVGQDCEDHRGLDGDPISRDLGIEVQFENPSDQVLRISESAIRLVVEDDWAGVKAAGEEEVAPHSVRTIVFEFTHHALCERNRDFKIAWDDALRLDNQPVAIAALTFSP